MACPSWTSLPKEGWPQHSFGNRTKGYWYLLPHYKRGNCSYSRTLWIWENSGSTSIGKMGRCWNCSLCRLRRTWKWNDRRIDGIPRIDWPRNWRIHYETDGFNCQHLQHASSCPGGFHLYRNYHFWILSGHGLFCSHDGGFNFSLGWSPAGNEWSFGRNAWWWRLPSLLGISDCWILWTSWPGGMYGSRPKRRGPFRYWSRVSTRRGYFWTRYPKHPADC